MTLEEMEKCKKDVLYFASIISKMSDSDKGKILLIMYGMNLVKEKESEKDKVS